MQTENFDFLKAQWPELFKHTALAETYIHADPATATIKLRCFAEALVGYLYRELTLPVEPSYGFFERLSSAHFESVVDRAVREKLHAIRIYGNKAAHGKDVDKTAALQLLSDAYLLGRWLCATYSDTPMVSFPEFVTPKRSVEESITLTAENERLAHQLAEAKMELEQLQAEEDEAQNQIADLSSSLDEARLSVFRNASTYASSSMDLKEGRTRNLFNIKDAFSEYTLTDGQSELVSRLEEFLSSDSESAFILRGYAGTGKTFITKGLTEYFQAVGRNYVLAAPTGKAAKVISNKTKSLAFTIHRTIYSFKDISEYRDDELDGTQTYKFYSELAVNELPVDTVYIVDEASMVPDVYTEAEFFRFGSGFLLSDFLKYVNLDHNDHRKKIIFIGDDAQLPPVGMSFSPALDADYLFREHSVRTTSYELTDVVRQKAESGVMTNSIILRKALEKGMFNQLSVDLQAPDVAKVEHCDLMDRYLDSCDGKINGESIVIAHSNADVAAYNKRIREHFFPGNPEVMAGDKVMAVTNCSVYGFFISNGDFGLVRQVLGAAERRSITIKRRNHDTGDVETIDIPLAFRHVEVGFRDLDGQPKFFEAMILENLLYSDQPSFSSDENKALYLDFCIRHPRLKPKTVEFKNTLMSDPYFNALRLKFGYAITCHKAQGSEWNNVFVKCKTNQNQLTAGYFRWFYTAITRTSKRLWLLDPPSLKIGGGIKLVGGGVGMDFPPVEPAASPMPINTTENRPFNEPGSLLGMPPISTGSEFEQNNQASVAVVQSNNSDTFGIPQTATFLLGVLARVREALLGRNILVDGIVHQQYQEAYTFRRSNDFARVDIGYNSKEKVTRVNTPIPSELAAEIQALLSSMVGLPIAAVSEMAPTEFNFDEEFLNLFHQRLAPIAEESGIGIQDVTRYEWHLRYRFVRGAEVAVYDVYFDGKKRFGKCNPLLTACSPGSLIKDVGVLLTQGLSS